MPRPSLRAVCVALAASLVATTGAAAQDAPAPLPATPEAAECIVEPRSEAEVRELGAAALAALEAAATPAAAAPASAGEPADPETVAAVTATVPAFYAWQNAGNYVALLALQTDEAAARIGGAGRRTAAEQGATGRVGGHAPSTGRVPAPRS